MTVPKNLKDYIINRSDYIPTENVASYVYR